MIRYFSFIILSLFLFCPEVTGSVVSLSLSGQSFRANVQSYKEIKEEGAVLQTDEFTCGAAALATVLREYGDEKITEEMLLSMETQLVKGKGLSLFQLQTLAERRGFKAEGYKIELANLYDFTSPLILHLKMPEGGHYMVYKGIQGDRIFLVDPAEGNIRMSLDRFASLWTGYSLALLEKNGEKLQNDFEPPPYSRPELFSVKMRK